MERASSSDSDGDQLIGYTVAVARNTVDGRDFGNNICFRRWWFVKDSCGIVCAIFTWLLLAYGVFAVNGIIIASAVARESTLYAFINGVLFNSLVFLAFFSHLRTCVTEPVSF